MKTASNVVLVLSVAAVVAAFSGAGCSSGKAGADTGNDVADVAEPDVARDSVQPVDVADNGQPDVAGDAVDAGVDSIETVEDVDDDASAGDLVDAADGNVDVEPEFHWASGCEPPAIGAVWTAATDSTFFRGPFIQMSDYNTATVVWRTETPTDDEGCVDYAWGDETGTACGAANGDGQYEIALSDLPPSTEVTYSVRVGDTKTTDLSFRTMPDRPRPMKFAVFADAHNSEVPLAKMSALALAEGVDFAFGNGDFASEGKKEEYDAFFRGVRDLASRVNIWAVPGNHDDKYLERMNEYFGSFVMPNGNVDEIATGFGEGWWSKRIGNVWIGGGWVRDFYLSMPDSDWGEVGWFRRQFETEEFKTAQWKLFFIHQPAYVREWGGCSDPEAEPYNGEVCLRVAMIPLLKEFGFHAAFHGHMHGIEYGVVDGVQTIIDGGVCDCGLDDGVCQTPPDWFDPWYSHYGKGSFSIVEAGCDKLTVRFVDLDGNEIDRLEIPATQPE